jgi:integrase
MSAIEHHEFDRGLCVGMETLAVWADSATRRWVLVTLAYLATPPPLIEIPIHIARPDIRWRHRRYVEDSEYLVFEAFAGDLIAAYLDFKLTTGLRKSDILNLTLSQIRDDGIHVTISKTGKRMVIEPPLSCQIGL